MFIVTLKFSKRRDQASQFMEGHNQWIKNGFADGVFLLAGSLQPSIGGSVIAHGVSREALERRINEDPFVAEEIVSAEIFEIEPKKVDERLSFLLN